MTSQFKLAEEKVTSLLPRIAGSLSILGSSAIILSMLINGRKKLKSSFNRLLFMMCCFDLSSSVANVWSSSALPNDNNHYSYGAAGNWTTCRIQGFMFQLGLAVPIYFYFLTIHYLLVIRYGMKEERIRHRIEPLMHAFALTFAIGTAVTGYILKLFNPFGNVCFISEYPKDCLKEDSGVDCIYGENSTIYFWIFAGIPSILPLFLVPFTMGLIFWTVRKQTLKMDKYRPNTTFRASNLTARQSLVKGQSTLKNNFSCDLSSISTLRRKLKCKTTERLKAVAYQGLAYTLCYLLVFSWPIVMGLFIVHSNDKKPPFFIVILENIFYPLQGFLNYIIYIRPFVVQIRTTHPEFSILQAMYVATFPQRQGRRNFMSICKGLNHCSLTHNNGSENTKPSEVDCQSQNGIDGDPDGGRDNFQSRKGLDPNAEKEENGQLGTVPCCTEDVEKELMEALARAAVHRDKTDQECDTQQDIKEESEYFQVIAELSKITGNHS